MVRRVIHDESAAQDVVQDTWVRGFTHLRELSAGAAFSTWIRRIAFHEAALATLPALFREVFWLRSVEGCSVAEALRVPEQTVKTRHFRARGALQERLASWFDQTDETPSIRVAVFG